MKYLYFFLFFALSIGTMAQGSDPVPATPTNSSPAQAPIEGGVLGLLAAGLTYGFYKFRKQQE